MLLIQFHQMLLISKDVLFGLNSSYNDLFLSNFELFKRLKTLS